MAGYGMFKLELFVCLFLFWYRYDIKEESEALTGL